MKQIKRIVVCALVILAAFFYAHIAKGNAVYDRQSDNSTYGIAENTGLVIEQKFVCKEASMDEDTLKKITQGFGAGLGTMAGTCGAISGAAVVAGLINQDKAGTSQTVRSVMNQFKQQNGTVICKDLKGVETGKVIRSCDDCVRDAVKFLEDALKSGN